MSATKLHIQMIERDAFDTWAIRFNGPEQLFMGLISCFQREGCIYARWDTDALQGKGGWIIDDSTLIRYADRFDNLKVSLTVTLQQKKQTREFALNLPYHVCEGCGEIMCDSCWETITSGGTLP